MFLERGEGREKGRERNINVEEKHQSVASCNTPNRGPGPQPRHVPWLGLKPATLQFVGRCPIHWATAVRALTVIFNTKKFKETYSICQKLWRCVLFHSNIAELPSFSSQYLKTPPVIYLKVGEKFPKLTAFLFKKTQNINKNTYHKFYLNFGEQYFFLKIYKVKKRHCAKC